MPGICRNIVFLSHFYEVKMQNLFYLHLLYLDNQQFLAKLFDLFLSPIFFCDIYFLFSLMVAFVSRYFGISFLKYGFSAFLLQLNFHFQSLLNEFLFLKNAQHLQEYCYFVSFLGGTDITFLLFYLDLLYLANRQFLAILFDLFLCLIFFQVFIFYFLRLFRLFQDLLDFFFFLKKRFFCIIFVVEFSFLKSVESISFLKKYPASAGILFFCLIFRRYKHRIYFILS